MSTGNDAMNAPVPLDGRSSIGSRATVAQERPTEFDRPRGGREEQEGAFRGRGLQVRMRVRVTVVQVLEEHTGQLPLMFVSLQSSQGKGARERDEAADEDTDNEVSTGREVRSMRHFFCVEGSGVGFVVVATHM